MNILVLVDEPNWSGDTVIKGVAKHSRYSFNIGYMRPIQSAKKWIETEDYDLGYIHVGGLHFKWIREYFNEHQDFPWILGIRGYAGLRRDSRIIPKFRAVSTGNCELEHAVHARFPDKPVFVCHGGVDTDLFMPSDPPERFTIGWAGKPVGIKRLQDFLNLPFPKLMATPYHRLYDGAKSYTHNQMPNFYKQISVYVNTAKLEGQPLPPLEAAACGRPVVAVRAGALAEWMPTEWLVDDAKKIAKKLDELKNDVELYLDASDVFRDISLNWDFSVIAEEYDTMFEECAV